MDVGDKGIKRIIINASGDAEVIWSNQTVSYIPAHRVEVKSSNELQVGDIIADIREASHQLEAVIYSIQNGDYNK